MPSQSFAAQKGLSDDVLQIQKYSGRKSQHRTDGKESLPGQARIQLKDTGFGNYMRKPYLVTELDKLAPYLRFVSILQCERLLDQIPNRM
jgi:hypothetical protein